MNGILVTLGEKEAVTTTLSIAEGVKMEHKSVIQLARSYQDDLEMFGRVAFEMLPFETNGGIQQREYAILNERQATLLISYMRNSEIVREFKIQLVKAFYDLAENAQNFALSEDHVRQIVRDELNAQKLASSRISGKHSPVSQASEAEIIKAEVSGLRKYLDKVYEMAFRHEVFLSMNRSPKGKKKYYL